MADDIVIIEKIDESDSRVKEVLEIAVYHKCVVKLSNLVLALLVETPAVQFRGVRVIKVNLEALPEIMDGTDPVSDLVGLSRIKVL